MKIFVPVSEDADLLPHFLKHYIENGYRQIIVGLSQAPGAVSLEEVDAHRKAIRSTGIVITVEKYGDPNTPDSAEFDRQWIDRARAFWCGPDEWHGIAALGEHHIYDGGLSDMVARAEDMGADYISGQLIDWVAADGSAPPLPLPPTSRPQAFLPARRSSGAVLVPNAATTKVCLVRGQIIVGSEHHFVQDGRRAPDIIPVLHYQVARVPSSSRALPGRALAAENGLHR